MSCFWSVFWRPAPVRICCAFVQISLQAWQIKLIRLGKLGSTIRKPPAPTDRGVPAANRSQFEQVRLLSDAMSGSLDVAGRSRMSKWRRERDSNPRSPLRLSGFQDRSRYPEGFTTGSSKLLKSKGLWLRCEAGG